MPRFGARAIAFRCAAQDVRALALVYSEAAQDAEFRADNEAVQADVGAVAREADAAAP